MRIKAQIHVLEYGAFRNLSKTQWNKLATFQ